MATTVPICGSQAFANVEVADSGTPSAGVTMSSVYELHQKPGSFIPQLRNGIEANSADWPVSFFVFFNTPRGRAACTAALIGPKVLLTAGHCVPSDNKLALKFGGHDYPTDCDRHAAYTRQDPDLSADFALCRLKESFPLPAGARFETVATPTLNVMTGQAVVLSGYGCTSDVASAASADGKYRIGINSVVQTSNSPTPMAPFTADYYAPRELNNLFTSNSGANLCPGDSGGPAFQIVEGPESGSQYPNRLLVGVNSRVAYADSNHLVFGPSVISATGGPSFRSWAEHWACERSGNMKSGPGDAEKKSCDPGKELPICGLTGQPLHCRGSGM